MLEVDTRTYALTFTGQGSQFIGMGKGLEQSVEARRIIELADDIVGFSLSGLCKNGPIEELSDTSKAQPAIVAISLAALAAAKEFHPELFEKDPTCVAGHSVGELTALVVAGGITEGTAIDLARQRGILMKEASQKYPGRMAALHRFRSERQVRDLCKEAYTQIANFNGPGQIIISGGMEQVEEALRLAAKRKMKAIPLDISGGFHSLLMEPIQSFFEEILSNAKFNKLRVPIVLNATYRPTSDEEKVKKELVKQLIAPVKWARSVRYITDRLGVNIFLECGPKDILTGLLRRMDGEVKGVWIGDYRSAQALSF